MSYIIIETHDFGFATYQMRYRDGHDYFNCVVEIRTGDKRKALEISCVGLHRHDARHKAIDQIYAVNQALRVFGGNDSNGTIDEDGFDIGVVWQTWRELTALPEYPIAEAKTDGIPDCVLAAQAAT